MDGIDFYITDAFGEGLYESCKDVKFGTMNMRALELIGSGAKNFKGELIILSLHYMICVRMSQSHRVPDLFWQSGLLLLVSKQNLTCQVHHMPFSSSQLLLNRLG